MLDDTLAVGRILGRIYGQRQHPGQRIDESRGAIGGRGGHLGTAPASSK